MKNFKIGFSFFFLILICVVSKNLLLLINYLLALFLHETAHLVMATYKGYSLNYIKLDIGGLSINLKEDIKDKDSFLINVAGPVCNIVLCLICMSLYWLFPKTYQYLNLFCTSNLLLALFNLLPIYPLDGGKIFRGIIKNVKVLKIVENVLKYTISALCVVLYICTFKQNPNHILLVISLFFLFNKTDTKPTFSIFKSKDYAIQKVNLLRVNETENLYSLIKKIKKHQYTIFYCKNARIKYIDEDEIVALSLKHNLNTKLCEISSIF